MPPLLAIWLTGHAALFAGTSRREDLTCRKIPTHNPRMSGIDVYTALANPVRREILQRLREGPRPARELTRGFDIGRPAVSEHLQLLREAHLVHDEPRGRERYYHLDPRPLADVESWLDALTRFSEKRLQALEALLDQEDPA